MGSYLDVPLTEKKSIDQACKSGKVKYGACEMQGWRTTMEDAIICQPDIAEGVHFFGVYDGHGGNEVADFVKEHLIGILQNLESFKAGKYGQALIEVNGKIDDLLRSPFCQAKLYAYKKENTPETAQLGRDKENLANTTGCTACQVIITPDKIIVGNAGDSRAVVAIKTAKPNMFTAQALSVDHKPNLPAEKLRIEQAGGFVSDNRVKCNLNLSRSLGDLDYKSDNKIKSDMQMVICKPEIQEFQRKDAQFLIIACDGIWDCLTNQQAVDYIGHLLVRDKDNKDKPISSSIESMFTTIIAPDKSSTQGLGTDNMSTIVIQFDK